MLKSVSQSGQTLLHTCSWFGTSGTLSIVARYGYNISAKNTSDQQPIHLSVLRGHLSCLRIMVAVNFRGFWQKTLVQKVALFSHQHVEAGIAQPLNNHRPIQWCRNGGCTALTSLIRTQKFVELEATFCYLRSSRCQYWHSKLDSGSEGE